jgi:hypothetical protein
VHEQHDVVRPDRRLSGRRLHPHEQLDAAVDRSDALVLRRDGGVRGRSGGGREQGEERERGTDGGHAASGSGEVRFR